MAKFVTVILFVLAEMATNLAMWLNLTSVSRDSDEIMRKTTAMSILELCGDEYATVDISSYRAALNEVTVYEDCEAWVLYSTIFIAVGLVVMFLSVLLLRTRGTVLTN